MRGTVSCRALFACLLDPRCPTPPSPVPSASGRAALAPALRQRARPRARRSDAGAITRLYVVIARRRARARAAAARSCASSRATRSILADLPGLGSAALRPLLAASGHHLRPPARARTSCRDDAAAACIVAADTLMQRLPPRALCAGARVRARRWARRWASRRSARGWSKRATRSVSQVTSPGEFARARLAARRVPDGLRGRRCASTCSTTRSRPSARFDPETQRSLRLAEAACACCRRAKCRWMRMRCKAFRRRFRTRFEGDPTQQRDLSRRQRRARAARHRVLPAAVLRRHRHAVRLSAEERRAGARRGAARRADRATGSDIETRYEDRRHDIERPVLAPDELFVAPDELERAARRVRVASRSRRFKADSRLRRHRRRAQLPDGRAAASCASIVRAEQPFAPLAALPARRSTDAC